MALIGRFFCEQDDVLLFDDEVDMAYSPQYGVEPRCILCGGPVIEIAPTSFDEDDEQSS